MAIALPRNHPYVAMPYGSAMRSMAGLRSSEPTLRSAMIAQAALFSSFTVFWTILSLRLLEPRVGMGPEVAGIFGIIGATGILAAPLAGRTADRRGPHLVVVSCAIATLGSWLVFGVWGSLAGLVVGVIIMDMGVNSALVANQHQIFALRPEARSRLNTLFMTAMFIGGSLGSMAGSCR